MNFSERNGLTPVRQLLQVDDMDDVLRTSLWNALHLKLWDVSGFMWPNMGGVGVIRPFSRQLWFTYFKRPIDEIPTNPHAILEVIRYEYFSMSWNEIYDFLEAIVAISKNQALEMELNVVLSRELAGYGLIGGHVVDVTDPQEIAALEEALNDDAYRPVHQHLSRALELLADRKQPDFRNSIKRGFKLEVQQ